MPDEIAPSVTTHRAIRGALLLLLLVAAACRSASAGAVAESPAPLAVVSDRLFFGRGVPGGGTVSDADWTAFVDSVVTPRFPAGLTIWHAQGQWRGADGALVRETVMVLEVLRPDDSTAERAVREIADEYKRRFKQDAVLRATERTTMRLHD